MSKKYRTSIQYTHVYTPSYAFFITAICYVAISVLYININGVLGKAGTIVCTCLMIGHICLGAFYRVRIRYRVYIKNDGIHIISKSDDHEILLPRENYTYYKLFKSRASREPSCILIAKEIPPDLLSACALNEFPKFQEIKKYGLDDNLIRMGKGQLSEVAFVSQDAYILQFYVPNDQSFDEIWRFGDA